MRSNQLIHFKYVKKFTLKVITIVSFLNITYSFGHNLPSHFADHNHESDPKFERPYIRVKSKN